jgi:beta-phosphoglucomutase
MTLKAILFDFNGVIINDEPIHEILLGDLLLGENLLAQPGEFAELCLGRSDRACITDLLTRRGRIVRERDLERLLAQKSLAYQAKLNELTTLPTYPGLTELIERCLAADLSLAVVSGALRCEVELVLGRLGIRDRFSVIVAGDDITTSKPEPNGYLLAVERLNQAEPTLDLKPENCLAIEDTFPGIQAAKAAGISVVGVAHSYPFHMIQRQANWTIDYLSDLELDRICSILAGKGEPALVEPELASEEAGDRPNEDSSPSGDSSP